MKVLQLFLATLMVGSCTFGGGYAILPVLKGELVDKLRWVSAGDFAYAIAVGQLTPGPLSILVAFLGWKIAGLAGAIAGTLGLFLPAFVAVLLVCRVYDKLRNHPRIEGIFTILSPIIGALLASVAVDFGKNFWGTGWTSYGVALGSFLLMSLTSISPAWLFGGCLLAGILLR